jgi:hypothetical protein
VLPDFIAEPTFTISGGLLSAHYDDDRDWTRRMLETFAYSSSPNELGVDRRWFLDALPGWVLADGVHGEIGFPDVTTIPGWESEWETRGAGGNLTLVGPGEATKYAGVSHASPGFFP